jgi:hypothetical protein
MQFDTVFERTDAGLAEIHEKSNRLTQSERLVLIMTDGRTDIATLIEKLPSLSMPRVFRAITKLQDMGLMGPQIIAPVGAGNANDAIAPEVVERFLEQTDLDPATVMRPDVQDFSPTTLPSTASLREPTAPARADTELERRLQALMGETPKFARPDAPPLPAAPVSAAPLSAALPPAAPVAAAPAPAAVPMPAQLPPEVAPEDVVRAARQQPKPTLDPRATGAIRPASKDDKFDIAMPSRTQNVPPPARTGRITPPAQPPRQANNWPLYVLVLVGVALVGYSVLRMVLR